MQFNLVEILGAVGLMLTTIVGGFISFFKLASRGSAKQAQGTKEIITALVALEGRTQAAFAEIDDKHGVLISRFDRLEVSVGLRLDRVEQQIISLQELHKMASLVEVTLAKFSALEKQVDSLTSLKDQMQNEQTVKMLRLQLADLTSTAPR